MINHPIGYVAAASVCALVIIGPALAMLNEPDTLKVWVGACLVLFAVAMVGAAVYNLIHPFKRTSKPE